MIQIHNDQIETLSSAAYRNFESRVFEHLNKFFPSEISAMSESQAKTFVRTCVDNAKRYELESEQEIVYFAHLPLLLGDDFERNPKCEFALAVLDQKSVPPNARAKIAMNFAHQLKAKGLIS